MNLSEEELQPWLVKKKAEDQARWEFHLKRHEQMAPYREQQRKQREAEERAEQERIRHEEEKQERLQKHRDMQNNSVRYFMTEASCLQFDPKERTPSAVLYEAYCRWCKAEKLFPESIRGFCVHLKKNAWEYKIAPTNFTWQGRHIRGFRGLYLTEEEHSSYTTHA